MNLRKSRFSSEQKRSSSRKDIKSSVKKGTGNAKNMRHSRKILPETPLKTQKSIVVVLDTTMKNRRSSRSSSNVNILTSTPIPNGIGRKTMRSSGTCDLDETVKLKSFNRLSYPITSSPIQKTLIQTKSCEEQTKPCEIRLIAVMPPGQIYAGEDNLAQNLRSNKKSPNPSLNASCKILESSRSKRSSMTLKPQNFSKKTPNNIKMSLSKKSQFAKKNSITEKKLSGNQKSAEDHIVLQNESKSKKCVKVFSACAEKLSMPSTSNDANTMSAMSSVISATEKNPEEVSWTSRDSLVQSFNETRGNSKSSRYSLRSSIGSQKKSPYNKKKKERSLSERETETSKPSRYSLRSSIGSQKQSPYNKKINVKKNLSERKTETSKYSSYCSQLQNQHLSERASTSRLVSDEVLQDVTETPKNLIKQSAGVEKRSRCSLRLKEIQLSKKQIVNESSPEKSAVKKQKIKKVNQNIQSNKKLSGSSKKQNSSKKLVERYCMSMGDIPIDDLALSAASERRKVQSDGFKVPSKNILKRKRSALEAKIQADEDYEDDIFENNSKKFDKFKDLLLDTSDSERSFAVSTPKFPCTPLIRHKTPKFKDCFSPKEFEIKRKAALKYMNKNKRNSGTLAKTPVIAEKKRLEYSRILEQAQELKEAIDSLTYEESDEDSYFTF